MTNTTRNGVYKLCFNLLLGWILILNQNRLHWVSEMCNLQGPRELLILQSRWGSILIKCMWEESKGGGCILCIVLQQWVLASNNSLHSINCMELDCAINHKLIMIMLQCYNLIFQEFEPKQSLYDHITTAHKLLFLKCGGKTHLRRPKFR